MEHSRAVTGEQLIRDPAVRADGSSPFGALSGNEQLGPLDRPSPEAFDRLARLACRLLDVPAAHIGVASGATQHARGWSSYLPTAASRRSLPLSRSICDFVIHSGEPFVVADFREIPESSGIDVVPEFGGVAYMAVPLFSTRGEAFGALSVLDLEPRHWTGDELSALRDLAASVASEIELAQALLEAERRAGEAEHARRERTALLESVPQGIFGIDVEARCTFINRAAAQMLGWLPNDAVGRELHELLPHTPADGTPYPPDACPLLGTMRTGSGIRLERELVHRRNGTTLSAEIAAEPVTSHGRVIGGVVTVNDVTARERSVVRTRFLADVSKLLARSLDYETTLGTVAALAVPDVCDVCIVYILQPDGTISRLAVQAADDQKRKLLGELRQRHPISIESRGNSVARVMHSGEPELYERVTDRHLDDSVDQQEVRELLQRIGLHSLMVAPLVARDRMLGAIAFATSESGRVFSQEDLAFARDVASRAALAIDNAELFRAADTARREAEGANEAKSAFLAVMSHELRTPLSGILGYAELLADGITGPVSSAQQEQLGRIKACAGHLLGLIDEILSFARLEADREEVRFDQVELGAMTRVAAALVGPLAEEKGLRFALNLPTDSVTVRTDPGKVGQILVHLLTNAVKFTERGGVRLDVHTAGEEMHFAVTDTGVGIAAEHGERIFDRFWQVENPATRASSGTGIGLPFARRLARLLHGDIAVESIKGQGSTFTLSLPLDGARTLEHQAETPPH
jgi:PAS domain S-box-containing protein